MTFDVRAVANYLLDKAQVDNLPVDHMKLQKLAYIAHGWHLAVTSRPLFFNSIEAWKYGPVIPDLYREFKRCGHKAIENRVVRFDPNTKQAGAWTLPSGSPEAEESRLVIDRVWDAYKKFSAVQLSTMTHQKGTPWETARKRAGTDQFDSPIIPDADIQSHYLELAAKNREQRS
jgi:uncharacterized phage-associated protein